MSNKRGRVCVALAKKLQAQFPSIMVGSGSIFDKAPRVIPLLWLPENLFPATGAYRTDWRQDCWRWEGFGHGLRDDGTTYPTWTVGGYTTMTDLIKPGTLTIHEDGEVTNDKGAK